MTWKNKHASFKADPLRLWDSVFFLFLFLGYTGVMGWLFYHQAIGNENWFHSDIKAYLLEMQGLESGYQFPYPLFFRLGAFFNLFFSPETAIAIAQTLLNSASLILLKYYLNRYLMEPSDGASNATVPRPILSTQEKALRLLGYFAVSLLALSLLLVSMLFPLDGSALPGIQGRYKGVFSPNPHHNATYLAARPFAIACFFQFSELLESYEKQFSWKKGLCFSVTLLLATLTKPSFTFVLVGCAGLIMLYRLLRQRFSNLLSSLKLGLCFIPTFAALLYQFFGVFASGPETGVGFGWLTAWSYHCSNIPLAILLAFAFPLTVLLLHWKECKTTGIYRLSVQLALMSLAMVTLLYEKGFREGDMNFSWGYMYGMFFAFTASAIVLVRSTVKRQQKWYLLALQWSVYLLHLGCGLLYLKNSLAGFLYY